MALLSSSVRKYQLCSQGGAKGTENEEGTVLQEKKVNIILKDLFRSTSCLYGCVGT